MLRFENKDMRYCPVAGCGIRGPYKRTLIAALVAYPRGAGVHEGAGVHKNYLVYPASSCTPAALPWPGYTIRCSGRCDIAFRLLKRSKHHT